MKQKPRTRKIYHAPKPIAETNKRAHCTFCGGLGANMEAENVWSKTGTRYRVPKSHTSCKTSILSLSLSLFE